MLHCIELYVVQGNFEMSKKYKIEQISWEPNKIAFTIYVTNKDFTEDETTNCSFIVESLENIAMQFTAALNSLENIE